MKNTKRALRRHHRQRMIGRALRSLVLSDSLFQRFNEAERYQRSVRWCNNLQKCSCYMCGNPRKFRDEPTVQERRFNEAAGYEWAQFFFTLRRRATKQRSRNRPAEPFVSPALGRTAP